MTDDPLREQLRRARNTARKALQAWSLETEPLKVLRNLQNTTFLVGDSHILRLSHPGYQSDRAIASEIMVLEHFAGAGLPVPAPVPTKTGETLIKVDGDRVVLFPRARGRFASASFGRRKARLQGELVGRLHQSSEAFKPPSGFTRLEVTPATLLAGKAGDEAGEVTLDVIQSVLGARGSAVIQRAAELVRETWSTLGPSRIIHTDITPWNTMWEGGRPFLIDFDDSALGPLAYDLGVIRCEYDDLPDSDTLWQQFVAGYTSVRELPEGVPAALPGLVAARHLLFASWLVLNIEHPAFSQAREWLDARLEALEELTRTTTARDQEVPA